MYTSEKEECLPNGRQTGSDSGSDSDSDPDPGAGRDPELPELPEPPTYATISKRKLL